LSGDVALVSGFRAGAGYTFTGSRILKSTSTSPVFAAGNWAFRRPRHAGFVNLAWAGGRASIDLAGSFAGRRVDSDFASLVPAMVENPAYAAWDLRGAFRLTRTFSATLAIDNLTGSDRMEPLGYPVLGRAVRAGIRVRF
jgi:outer membrane cobalamin receptor